MFNFNQTFDVLYINQDIVNKYFDNLKIIQKGIQLKLSRESDTFDIQLKKWIKENVAMNDKYFLGELISFKFHINSQSLLNIRITSGTHDLYSETQEFDFHTTYLRNFNWSSINTEREITVSIKLEDLSIHQENFNYLLRNKSSNFTEDYLKNLFGEILRETQTKKEFMSLNLTKFDFITNLKVLSSLVKQDEQKFYISKFLETLDVYHLFFLLKDNFWKNSNF